MYVVFSHKQILTHRLPILKCTVKLLVKKNNSNESLWDEIEKDTKE